MLFALLCTDKPQSVDLRMSVRADHLQYLESLGTALKAAGPFTDDRGQPTGSLVVIEAADRAAAKSMAENDPYAKAGLFASVDIKPWKWLIKNPEAQ
jgi:uncharacterized protein YciI